MTKFIIVLGISSLSILSLISFNFDNSTKAIPLEDKFEIPENVNNIFNASCYKCHGGESKNYKARMKLKLDQLSKLKKSKLVSKLGKIAKEVEKGDMPTKKFVKNNPENVPTEEDKKVIIDWARKLAQELVGE